MEHNLVVLVADDERAVRRFLKTALETHHYKVYEAVTGEEALQKVIHKRPDLIILDLGLPDMTGIEVTESLREWSDIPILILTVQEKEQTKIAALDAGADDYLTKPFGVGELMARLRAMIRRVYETTDEPIFRSGQLCLDMAKRIVTRDGEQISLTPTEYDLLKTLAQESDKVLTHHQIIQAVWGDAYLAEPHLLRVNISNLRKKIEQDPSRPKLIITEPGVGYRLRQLEE